MRARMLVRNSKATEAFELRVKISSLEEEQRRRVASSAGMLKLAQVGQELKWLRFRLAILEDCVAALSTKH
ncbi:hypothetical protein A9K65_021750 [Mesorhizobium sp. WSM1497]|nr:hypothetical protein A9K65_021750 [Mesorhizobium sp. WSM1497]